MARRHRSRKQHAASLRNLAKARAAKKRYARHHSRR